MLQSPCDFGGFGPVPPPRGHDHRHVKLSCLCESQCAGSRSLLEAPPQASNRQHPAGRRGQLGQLYDPATNTSLLPRRTSPKERVSFARRMRIRNMTSSAAWLVPWKHIMMHAAASALKCMLKRAGHMICNGRPQTELHASPFVLARALPEGAASVFGALFLRCVVMWLFCFRPTFSRRP